MNENEKLLKKMA